MDRYFDGGDRIKFRMGYTPKYTKIECLDLITETTYFDGLNTITPTDAKGNTIKLLETDENWTLLVEYKPSAVSNNVLISCFNNNYGFGIGYKSGMSVWWGAKQWASGKVTARNRVILQHIKGETGIKAFIAEPWSNNYTIQEFDNLVENYTSAPLTFGGTINPQGNITASGTGYIYECKLWKTALGDAECGQLVT